MHVALTHLFEAYDRIRETAACSGSTSSVLIFVTPDVDSICGLKILTVLLRSDSIVYEILPVSSYAGLSSANDTHVKNNRGLRIIIMLGCGALVDIASVLSPHEGVLIHVIDSHRPYNLQSLFSSTQVVIWDDGSVKSLEKVKNAYRALSSVESLGTEDAAPALESLSSLPEEVLAQNAMSLKDTIRAYYSSPCHNGMSVSGILYTLTTQLGRQTQALLWMAIVGLTDQLLSEYMPSNVYDAQISVYRQELIRLNGTDTAAAKKGSGLSHQIDDLISPEKHSSAKDEHAYSAGDNSIKFGQELKFTLLRHWSLYEAMYHSVFVSSKLGLWRDKGRRKLMNLLVKMGLPHKEIFQLYSQMSVSHRRAVKDRLVRIAPKYNMGRIAFRSFWKHYGYKGTLSASDMVYSLSTILQLGFFELPPLQSEFAPRNTSEKFTAARDIEFSDSLEFVDSRLISVGAGTQSHPPGPPCTPAYPYPLAPSSQLQWVSNFYIAYDALDSFEILRHGVMSSIALQKLLVATGIAILEKNLMQVLTGFQLAILRSPSSNPLSNTSSDFKSLSGEYSIFGKSESCLCCLTKFLYKAYVKYKKKLPTVVAAFNPDKNSYLVATFAENDILNSLKTPLGMALQESASRIGIAVKRDSFHTAVVEVSQDDISDFLESLQVCIQ